MHKGVFRVDCTCAEWRCIYLEVCEPVVRQSVHVGVGVSGWRVMVWRVRVRVYLPVGLRTCSTTVCT